MQIRLHVPDRSSLNEEMTELDGREHPGSARRCSKGRHSHIDRSGRETALLQVKPISQNHCFIEGQSRFGTVLGAELIDSVLISAPRVGRTKAPEDCGFRVLQNRYTELSLGLVLRIRQSKSRPFYPEARSEDHRLAFIATFMPGDDRAGAGDHHFMHITLHPSSAVTQKRPYVITSKPAIERLA